MLILHLKRKNMLNKSYLRGFTLTEILVTLTIIGIVAALTIPVIIQNIQTIQNKAAFKKVYADLDQATRRILIDYGGTINGICAQATALERNRCIRDKYSKKCSSDDEDLSWDNCFVMTAADGGEWKNLDNTNPIIGQDASAILSNGVLIHTWLRTSGCTSGENEINNICARIIVDVNGFKKPNVTGKDIFLIHLVEQGIKPYGTQGDDYECTTTSDGWGCAAAYLLNNE